MGGSSHLVGGQKPMLIAANPIPGDSWGLQMTLYNGWKTWAWSSHLYSLEQLIWSNLCRVSSCFDIWRLVAQESIGHRLSYQSAANWICSDNLQRRSQIVHVLSMYTYYIWVKARVFSIIFCLSCHSPHKQHDKSQCCNRFFVTNNLLWALAGQL